MPFTGGHGVDREEARLIASFRTLVSEWPVQSMSPCGEAVRRVLSWVMQIKPTTPRCPWCTRGPPCTAPPSALCRFHQLVVVLQQLVSSRSQHPRRPAPWATHRAAQGPPTASWGPGTTCWPIWVLESAPRPDLAPARPPALRRRSPLQTRPPTPPLFPLGSGASLGPGGVPSQGIITMTTRAPPAPRARRVM